MVFNNSDPLIGCKPRGFKRSRVRGEASNGQAKEGLTRYPSFAGRRNAGVPPQSAALFNSVKPLNRKESTLIFIGHVFHFPCSEKSGTDLFRASLLEDKIDRIYCRGLFQTPIAA